MELPSESIGKGILDSLESIKYWVPEPIIFWVVDSVTQDFFHKILKSTLVVGNEQIDMKIVWFFIIHSCICMEFNMLR